METLALPVARFFAQDAGDPQELARCFTEDGVVFDEGGRHRGRPAIAAWNANVVAKYGFATKPLSAETTGPRTTVTAEVSGAFPGSPIHLRFGFTVMGDLISELEIRP